MVPSEGVRVAGLRFTGAPNRQALGRRAVAAARRAQRPGLLQSRCRARGQPLPGLQEKADTPALSELRKHNGEYPSSQGDTGVPEALGQVHPLPFTSSEDAAGAGGAIKADPKKGQWVS